VLNPYVLLGAVLSAVALAVGGYFFGYDSAEGDFAKEKVRLTELAKENTIFIQGEDRVIVKEVIKWRQKADNQAVAVRDRITNAKPSVDWSVPADDVGVWNAALCAGYDRTSSAGATDSPAASGPTAAGVSKQGGGAQQSIAECG
jgi:hypothetical protein